MSSAEQQGISVDVDHNPYLAAGSGTVDAIVSITADAAAAASAPDREVRGGEDLHPEGGDPIGRR
jgi:hypothetical protein